MTKPHKLRVLKFGGSSLSTPEQIRSIARKLSELHRTGENLIVVVSAMGKTTDQLLKLAHEVSTHPNRRELDMLLSTGERMSMALMSMALHDMNCPSISFTGSQAGVLTDGSFSNARITELKPIRVAAALKENKVVVLAGFQGVDPTTKEITTLGRGGSDTTAVAMAAHFHADRCEILKDVDGVYSADPRIVANAHLHKQLPIQALYEFCFWGAKVLNYRSVEWARDHHVPLFIGRSDNFAIGTEVTAATDIKPGSTPLLGVNSHTDVLEIACAASDTTEGLRTLENIVTEKGLPFPQILDSKFSSGTFRAHITLDTEALNEIASLLQYSSKMQIITKNLSSVTKTFVDTSAANGIRSETIYISKNERESAIQRKHK